MIYPRQEPVGYADIAADLREQITTGALRPGQRLVSERDLAATLDVNRGTVHNAMLRLRDEGLVVSRRGYGWCVAEPAEVETIWAGPEQRVSTRPPTPKERRDYGVGDGYGLLVVTDVDGLQYLYAGDRYEIVMRSEPAPE